MLGLPRTRLPAAAVLATIIAATASLVAAEDIDPNDDNAQFAWAENVGWINAEPGGPGGVGIDVTHTELLGYMWGENIGWINLNCKNRGTCATVQYAVTNDFGKLGGYAWAENVGWISFCDQDTPGTCKTTGSDYRVTINLADGIFAGYAWGENIGWISFSDTTPVAYRVQTDMNDGDAVAGNTDTCPWDANPAQTNTDAAPITTSPFPNDVSIANSDPSGDACDEDDDNDGILDLNEAAGCNGGANLSATNPDSDGDLNRDGAECALGSNPNDATSRPAAVPPGDTDADGLPSALETSIGSNPAVPDTDGDGIADGFEFRGYTTSPTLANTDGDTCNDDVEIASLDSNTVVNASDLLLVAQSFNLNTRPNFDINKNGVVQASDLLLVAQNFIVAPC